MEERTCWGSCFIERGRESFSCQTAQTLIPNVTTAWFTLTNVTFNKISAVTNWRMLCSRWLVRYTLYLTHTLFTHWQALQQIFLIHYTRGGQTAARKPHAVLRTSACGSLSFSKYHIFDFWFFSSIAKWRNIVKCYCRTVLLCKSFQTELWCHRSVDCK